MTEARYGNTGRNQFYGPGFWNYNMSLFRTFPLHGRTRLQFRVEGFSLTNHAAVVESERQRDERKLHAHQQHAR